MTFRNNLIRGILVSKIYLVISDYDYEGFQINGVFACNKKAKELFDKTINTSRNKSVSLEEHEIEDIVLKNKLLETIDLDLAFMDTAVKRNVYPISSNHKIQIDAEIATLKRYRKIIEEMV